MDAAQTTGVPGTALRPVVNGAELNFVPPDDFAPPFHRLVDSIKECMTTVMEQVRQRYVAASEVYEERVNAWATEKRGLVGEKEELNAQLKQARTTVDSLTATIKERDEKLRRYESYVAELQNVDADDFSKQIQSLWEGFKGFAEKYFLVDISDDLFEQTRWDRFIENIALKRGTPPLPLRNTDVAKKVRTAAALAIIASQLATRIFTPFYKPAASDDIRELLLGLAEEDCQKELMCRALLLSQWTEEGQREAEEGLRKEVIDTVTKGLGFWIDDNKMDAFRQELRDLLKGAMRLWRGAQNSTSKFDATVDDIRDPGWGILSDLNNGEPPADSHAKSAILALFPRILIIREDEDEVLFAGIGLWDWQRAAAEQELREDMEARQPKRRKERKMSNNESSGAPTSPTKLKSTAFLGRRRTATGDGSG